LAGFADLRGEASVDRRTVAARSDASVRAFFVFARAPEPPPATRATDGFAEPVVFFFSAI